MRILRFAQDDSYTARAKWPRVNFPPTSSRTLDIGGADSTELANASSGKNYIETVWGRGYVLREPIEAEARIPA